MSAGRASRSAFCSIHFYKRAAPAHWKVELEGERGGQAKRETKASSTTQVFPLPPPNRPCPRSGFGDALGARNMIRSRAPVSREGSSVFRKAAFVGVGLAESNDPPTLGGVCDGYV